jgi:hypothetical protein
MKNKHKINPQFIVDSSGNQTSVILPIEEYHELLEDLEDLAIIAERRDEPTISHEQVLKEMKKDGYLQD